MNLGKVGEGVIVNACCVAVTIWLNLVLDFEVLLVAKPKAREALLLADESCAVTARLKVRYVSRKAAKEDNTLLATRKLADIMVEYPLSKIGKFLFPCGTRCELCVGIN